MIHKHFGLLLDPDPATSGGGTTATTEDQPWFDPKTLSFTEGWQDKLPEEHKDLRLTAAKYKTLPDLVKANREAVQMANSKLEGYIKMPGKDAKPEEIRAYYDKLGVPADAKGYEFTKPADAELAKLYDAPEIEEIRTVALAKGMTKDQAQSVVDLYVSKKVDADKAFVAEGEKFIKEYQDKLTEVWGDKREANLLDAKRVAATIGGIDPNTLDTYPAELTMFLAKIAQGGLVKPDGLVTAEQLSNKIKPSDLAYDIQTNPKNPEYDAYHDAGHINHEQVKRKVLDLNGKD